MPVIVTPGAPHLGSYVRTGHHGYEGRVIAIHHFCPQSEEWLSKQTFQPTEVDLSGRWYSVLTHGSGSVVVAESDVTVVEEFAFVNPYSVVYFGEPDPQMAALIDRINAAIGAQ